MERTRTSHILLILFRILFTILVLWTLWFIFHKRPGTRAPSPPPAAKPSRIC